MICSVCGTNQSSYKCPKCKQPYCCLNCFKIHKESCEKQININDQNDEIQTKTNENNIEISPFEIFRSHPEIINALSDPRLQKIIKRIDSAKDRETELEKELYINPDFKDFVDLLVSKTPPSIQP